MLYTIKYLLKVVASTMSKNVDSLTRMMDSLNLEDKITQDQIAELEGKKLLKLFLRTW